MKKLVAALIAVVVAGTLMLADDVKKSDSNVDLKGTLGCGHCTFHKTASCAAAFKTADGKLYVIDNPTPEVMTAREDGGTIKVTGTVTETNGLLHIKATKQELTK